MIKQCIVCDSNLIVFRESKEAPPYHFQDGDKYCSADYKHFVLWDPRRYKTAFIDRYIRLVLDFHLNKITKLLFPNDKNPNNVEVEVDLDINSPNLYAKILVHKTFS